MTEDKKSKYLLTGDKHFINGKIIKKGAHLMLTEAEAKNLINKVKLVEKPKQK